LRRIKAEEATRDIAVMILNAATEADLRLEGLKLGSVDFVPKPFQREELLARVKTQVDLSLARGRLEQQAADLRQINRQLQAEILARQLVEDDLKRAKAAAEKGLEKQQRLLASIVQSSADAILSMDMNGVVTSWNRGVEKVFGYPAAEMIGKSILILIPSERHSEEDMVLSPIRRGESIEHYETRRLRKDGSRIDVSVTVSPLRDAEAQIVGVSKIARNITEKKHAEAELLRSNAELEQFSYAISHDMRQPLRMILSYMQLLETGMASQINDEQRECFHFAIDGAKRLDRMMIALLEYSRVGRIGEPPAWMESRELLDEALHYLQPATAEAQARISVTGAWPRIFVSSDEMMRLMQNLISNAIKYRTAGRAPDIAIAGEMDGEEWRLSVSDNGTGIVPEQFGRLFHVFQRLHSRAEYEGSGIGLALCRKIAEHHGARIWAESTGKNQDARFVLVLPREWLVMGAAGG
jgi:PAS domain S-box-containing protein